MRPGKKPLVSRPVPTTFHQRKSTSGIASGGSNKMDLKMHCQVVLFNDTWELHNSRRARFLNGLFHSFFTYSECENYWSSLCQRILHYGSGKMHLLQKLKSKLNNDSLALSKAKGYCSNNPTVEGLPFYSPQLGINVLKMNELQKTVYKYRAIKKNVVKN